MNQSHNSKTPKIVGAVVITGVIAIAIMILVINPQQETNKSLTEPVVTTSQAETVDTLLATETHSASLEYLIPKGFVNDIQVSLTFKDDVVTDVVVQHEYDDEESEFYIDNFDAGVEESIVGKLIGDISRSNINGASLTSHAFFDVVDVIVDDAQASI